MHNVISHLLVNNNCQSSHGFSIILLSIQNQPDYRITKYNKKATAQKTKALMIEDK